MSKHSSNGFVFVNILTNQIIINSVGSTSTESMQNLALIPNSEFSDHIDEDGEPLDHVVCFPCIVSVEK